MSGPATSSRPTEDEIAGEAIATAIDLPSRAHVIDLSQTFEERMPLWHGSTRFFHNLCTSYWHGDPSVDFHLEFNEHTGTHVDAPAHFVKDEMHPEHRWIDELGVDALIGEARVIDFHDVGAAGVVTAKQLGQWEGRHGPLAAGEIALFNLGWAQHWQTLPEGKRYIDDWPYLSRDCAELLVERGVRAVGTDTLTPDPPGSSEYPVHRTLLPRGVLIVENLARLEELPERCVFLALPLKIRQGSGSPLRAVALLPHAGAVTRLSTGGQA